MKAHYGDYAIWVQHINCDDNPHTVSASDNETSISLADCGDRSGHGLSINHASPWLRARSLVVALYLVGTNAVS